MIPRIIHYCWFGGAPLSEFAIKCIESWKRWCPDYEIKEWNESNFDLNCCDYVKEAYQARKWAFVSDYARFAILYQYGGLYFDVDVEIIKSIDDIIDKGSFMGQENSSKISVNPGLGLGAVSGLKLYKEILDEYNKRHFFREDGTYEQITIVTFVTNIMKKYGLKNAHNIQVVDGIFIYPKEYFCPMSYATGIMDITENTRSVHYYTASWHSEEERRHHAFGQKMSCIFGVKLGRKFEIMYGFSYQLKQKYKVLGLKGTVIFLLRRILRRNA